ncbi:hypothetical protein [Plasmodium yoelii yoelii]|uniref:Uncharacterized protein n=1 Tax=Plasmodium yoelii yoelii TaxID=73239 RepID=Q7R7B6_PLAYO|nr:hypothetical protein [Plasmodium yoelii yoelii]
MGVVALYYCDLLQENFLLLALYLFTFQAYPISWFHTQKTPYPILPLLASMRVFPQPPTESSLPTLPFPYTGASSLPRTKGLCSH